MPKASLLRVGCLGWVVLFSGCRLSSRPLDSAVHQALKGQRGCVMISDLKSGRLLYGSEDEACTQTSYPPGSLFKIVSTLALTRSLHGRTPPTFNCLGTYQDRGKKRFCVLHSGHGPVTLSDALARSCNFYFRKIASQLTPDDLIREAVSIGFLPSSQIAQTRRAAIEDLIIGESSALRVTPVQLMDVLRRIAPETRLGFVQDYRWMDQGLQEAVEQGTAVQTNIPGAKVRAKTGSPSISDGSGKTHAWLIASFVVYNRPLGIVVFIDEGRGGEEAARVAGTLIRWAEEHPQLL